MRRTLVTVLVALGQTIPVGWRLKMTWSLLGRPIRRLLNSAASERFPVISLSGPLAGYRMRLDWQTQKGFVFGVYPLREIQVMTQEISEGAVACDVGAHVGYFTLLMAKLVGAGGRVVAFEALPENARFVEENARINHLSHVEIVAKAVLDRAQTVEYASEDADPLTMTAYIVEDGGRWSVEAVSLDEHFFGRIELISFVKMDVQGAEERVLAGMRRILSEHRPTLLVELHDIHTHGEDHPALLRLREAGYSWTFLGDFPPPADAREIHVLARPD
jgi:FkbM family methyltransferase